jgi:hypothetical protein
MTKNRARSGREPHGFVNRTSDSELPNGSRHPLLEVITPILPLLALAGGMLFALVRLLLASFYSRFGVAPEEVGWGIDAVLSQSAPAWVVLSGVGLSAIWIARKETGHLRQIVDWIARLSIPLAIVLVPALLISLVTSPVLLGLSDLWSSEERIKKGYLVESFAVLDLLPVEARCVTIEPKSTPTGSTFRVPSVPLMYLGQANSLLVLYEPHPASGRGITYRFPASELRVASSPCPRLAPLNNSRPEVRGAAFVLAAIFLGYVGVVAFWRWRAQEVLRRWVIHAPAEAERAGHALRIEFGEVL